MMDLFQIVFFFVLGAILAFCFLMLARNGMIFRCRQKANAICYQMGDWTIYDSKPSYEAMMWDLRKWTFKQFYPELCA
jgi:hypothetical protein